MTEGKITKWMIKEGDMVKEGATIAQVETDKATVDYESTEDIYIAKIIKQDASQKIKVGEIIGYAVETLDELKNFKLTDKE